MNIKIQTTICAIALVLSIGGEASVQQMIVISKEGQVYITLPSGKETPRGMMNLKNQFQIDGNCGIAYSSLDASGEKMGIQYFCRLSNDDCSKTQMGFYRIIIYDMNSKREMLIFDHGYMFKFSPDGKRVVIDVDWPFWRDDGCIPPQGIDEIAGTWVIDIQSGKKEKIDTLGVGVQYLNWSEHDGNIYFYNNSQIFKYDPVRRKGEIVDLPGFIFSPDGKYIIGKGDPVLIYRASDNQPVKEWNDNIRNTYGRFYFESWALNGGAVLLGTYKPNSQHNIVFDLKEGRVIQEFDGFVKGGDAAGTRFLVSPIEINKGRVSIKKDSYDIIEVHSSD
ncbi:MAG TPA: hypothetical protein VM658_06050 [bacterium]|nr:hypothetical protein [bacterium]